MVYNDDNSQAIIIPIYTTDTLSSGPITVDDASKYIHKYMMAYSYENDGRIYYVNSISSNVFKCILLGTGSATMVTIGLTSANSGVKIL